MLHSIKSDILDMVLASLLTKENMNGVVNKVRRSDL